MVHTFNHENGDLIASIVFFSTHIDGKLTVFVQVLHQHLGGGGVWPFADFADAGGGGGRSKFEQNRLM